MDATGLRVLNPKAAMGIVRDTLWVLVGDGRWVHFAALQSGDADAIEALICECEASTFQCDGTSVTNFIEHKWNRRRPGCHAHARRKLVEAARRGRPARDGGAEDLPPALRGGEARHAGQARRRGATAAARGREPPDP